MTRKDAAFDDSDRLGAKLAIVKAETSLAIAEARTGLVSELSNRLKIERSTNHFIQRLNMHKGRTN